MSDEMNKNQGRQTQDKAAKANGSTTPQQSLLNRKHHTPLQNLVLSSMADGDLFATLFNLYFYCMSECTDEVKKELFDFLTETEKNQETSLEKATGATLDLIDRALNSMRPIIDRTSKIQTI